MFWGARALVQSHNGVRELLLLPDRQCFERQTDAKYSKDEMCDWINNIAIPAIDQKMKEGFFDTPKPFMEIYVDGESYGAAAGARDYAYASTHIDPTASFSAALEANANGVTNAIRFTSTP